MFRNEEEPEEDNSNDGIEENAVVANSSKSDFAAALRSALNTYDSYDEITEKDLQELRAALKKEWPKENVDKANKTTYSKNCRGTQISRNGLQDL